ncbi:MAG: hypothetical protein ABSG42_01525 [Nitrospirota bacterium]
MSRGIAIFFLGIAVIVALLACPVAAFAIIDYGLEMSYQQNDTTNGNQTTTTAQERFSAIFNVNSAPNSRLTLTGILRLDVLENKSEGTSSDLQLQPNVELRLATKAIQLGVGYRELSDNLSTISGNTTVPQTDNSKDLYADGSFQLGLLPSLRLRYEARDDKQTQSGSVKSNTHTNDFETSTDFRIGLFTFNGDYHIEDTKDLLLGSTTDATIFTGQAAFVKAIGSWINVSFRENYSYSRTITNNAQTTQAGPPPNIELPVITGGAQTTSQYTSSAEGQVSMNPVKGMQLNSAYVYTVTGGLNSQSSVTKDWSSSLNYNLPKYIQFYSSYQLNQDKTGVTDTTNGTTIAGLNFTHRIGIFTINSRFETRYDSEDTSQSGSSSTKTNTNQDNIDWIIAGAPARFLSLALSESYVRSPQLGTSDNRFRLTLNIGPLKNLTLGPYIDYDMNTTSPSANTSLASGGTSSTGGGTTTEFVVPATFHLSLHENVDMDVMDSYQCTQTNVSGSASTSSQSNNAVARITLLRPFTGANISGAASFTSSSATGSASTTSSTYSATGSWSSYPHSITANLQYQTGSSGNSMTMATQYGLLVKLRNLAMSLSARYDYSAVFSNTKNGAQAIYLLMTIKK